MKSKPICRFIRPRRRPPQSNVSVRAVRTLRPLKRDATPEANCGRPATADNARLAQFPSIAHGSPVSIRAQGNPTGD